MKKLLMGALLVLMMFALVGCGEKAGGEFKGTTWVYEEYDEYTSWEIELNFNSESTGKLSFSVYGNGEKDSEYLSFYYTIDSSNTSNCNMVFEEGGEGYAEIKGAKLYFYSDYFGDLILEKR